MNAAQVHLALNHIPVIFPLVAFAFLLYFFHTQNQLFMRQACLLLVLAGVFSPIVGKSGEGAEDIVEKKPGVTHELIHEHEEMAETGILVNGVLGFLALLGIIVTRKNKRAPKGLAAVILVLNLASAIIMIRTSYLGGMIRHDELRGLAPRQSA